MNDHDLSRVLDSIHQDRRRLSGGPDIRRDLLMIPLHQTPQQRGWLPQFPKRRFQSMFSAAKLVVAGVIVALFGGFLLTGVLTQQATDEVLPAAASASAEPSIEADLLPGVHLRTEELETGVFRVESDGVRELSGSANFEFFPGYFDGGIVAGLDDSVWWLGRDGLFRLGEERVHAWPSEPDRGISYEDIEVGPEGTAWPSESNGGISYEDIEVGPEGTAWLAQPDHLRSFDGESWTLRREGPAEGYMGGIEVQQDGTVWVAEKPRAKQNGRTWRVVRIDADGSTVIPGQMEKISRVEMTVADDGGHEVWVMGPGGQMQRHDGSSWGVRSIPETLLRRPDLQGPLEAAVSPDGATLWVLLRSGSELARFDGSDWKVYGPDGLPTIGVTKPGGFMFEVARDGSLWSVASKASGLACDGVANFDGDTVRHFLRDLCVYDMDMAPDGSLWLQAGESSFEPERSAPSGETEPVHVFVITAEAVAAAE